MKRPLKVWERIMCLIGAIPSGIMFGFFMVGVMVLCAVYGEIENKGDQ